jgi:hypothetical protein
MKKTMLLIFILFIFFYLNYPTSVSAFSLSKSNQDYAIEETSNKVLNRKFISAKYNISVLFPSSWAITNRIITEYSVVKIRSNNGKGLESINITIIPLDNQKEYSIQDFKEHKLTKGMELIDSGYTEIANEKAIWRKIYFDSDTIDTIIANKTIKDMLSAPSFLYKKTDECGIGYQAQLVKNNHLYTITCSVLDSSKKDALHRFENNKDLLLQILHSFNFEKGKYYSSEHKLSISIPGGWSKLSARQGILVTYGKLGSGESFSINFDNVPPNLTIETLTWEQLFYPIYSSLSIEEEGSILLNGKPFKYCIYEITDPSLKKQQEGSYRLKYLATTFINNSIIYVITFVDSKDNFNVHYPLFVDTIKSIKLY